MKIAVTGADGFIGSHLVEQLVRDGHSVTALVNYNFQGYSGWLDFIDVSIKNEIKTIAGDVRDARTCSDVCKGQEAVLHLAALIGIPHSYSAPDSYVQTNVIGTLNMLEAARSNEVACFIHTSTSEVYGTAQYTPIDENHRTIGQSPYSASKIAADSLAFSYYASFELPVKIARPFNTFGPRQSLRAVIPTIILSILNEKPVVLGNVSTTRDFTYVSDTVRAFIALLESESGCGETFNFGTGFSLSISRLSEIIHRLMGSKLDPVYHDAERLRPSKSEVERLESNYNKFRNITGWEPLLGGDEDSLEKGLIQTIEWFEDLGNRSAYRIGTEYVR